MDPRTRSPLRMLAPAALAVFGVVALILLAGSVGDEEPSEEATPGKSERLVDGGGDEDRVADAPSSYTVEAGDTLDAIARKTGVDVDEIELLNPDLDPQALVTGQKVKLRE